MVNTPVAKASNSGTIMRARTQRTGPNGESTIRSKVPVSSSWRRVITGVTRQEVRTASATMPTTT